LFASCAANNSNKSKLNIDVKPGLPYVLAGLLKTIDSQSLSELDVYDHFPLKVICDRDSVVNNKDSQAIKNWIFSLPFRSRLERQTAEEIDKYWKLNPDDQNKRFAISVLLKDNFSDELSVSYVFEFRNNEWKLRYVSCSG
jgi:hypothetical protein